MNNDLISREYVEGIVEELENICQNAPEDVLDLLSKVKNAPTVEPFEPDYVGAERLEETNERLINEYISKVKCCDECFASVYCTINGLRESRVPQEYCVDNIKRYFGDKANLTGPKEQKGDAE